MFYDIEKLYMLYSLILFIALMIFQFNFEYIIRSIQHLSNVISILL